MHNQSASSTRDTWLRYTLGELGVFRKGRGIRKNEVLTHGIPCVRYGEIYTIHQSTIQQCHSFIDQRTASGSERLAYGDVIFAVSGETSEEIGKCSTFLGNYEAYVGSDTLILSPRGADPIYLGYALNFGEVLKQKQMLGQGDAVVHLSLANLAKVTISLPPLAEQIAIGQQLFQVDSHLFAIDKLISKKRDIKQGAMQQLLTGKTRLPGFVGEWIPQRLGDLATMSSGGTPPSKIKEFYGGNIKWASIADMTRSGKFLSKTDEHLTELGLINSSAAIYKSPVVLYAMYASLGEVCICLEEVSSSQAILGIVPGGKLELEFLYYLLLAYKPIVKSLGQQGTQSNLNKGMVQEFVFPVPANKLEQRAIAEVLSDMDAEINALVARREKTALIKIGMMQELLTGRTRLI